jgi:tetratricopeptide (TPR) repeat protein
MTPRLAAIGMAAVLGAQSVPDPLASIRVFVEAGNLPEAEQQARAYVQRHTDSAEGHYLLGYIFFKEQRAKDSLAEYTQGAKYKKPDAYDLETVGGDYVLLKDYPDADKWFTLSAQWAPGNFRVLYYLARTKYNENRFDEAVALFLECLKLDPKSIKAEDNLGLSYQGLNRNEEAIAAFRTAISWQSGAVEKDANPYLDLGSLLLDLERTAEALPLLQQAAQLAPQDMRMHRALGKAYLRLNDLEKAQAELERSALLAPQDAPIHFMLAQLYRKRGMTDKELAETKKYRELTASHSTDLLTN